MLSKRFQRSKEIFQKASDLPLAARADYLNQACGADETLRAEVEALFARHHAASSFLEHDAQSLLVPMLAAEAQVSLVGRQIGPFRLECELGRGGMGVVYLAQRNDGEFAQKVAIKLVHRGLGTEEMQRRFRRERQTLAALDHPHIARLFDGGVTEDLPYFVMEYVEGRPIDEFCDAHHLNIRARLALFQKVCEAVKYAHQHLIVHRDLKPSNILVNEEGVPKLLDFGIAKLLQQDGTEEKLGDTMTSQPLMTPHYASPEQARGAAISTVSDVYALGVILYELLTGHRPYQINSLSAREIERIICETEPEKPSAVVAKIASSNETDQAPSMPESISTARADNVEKLRHRLAGDLDSIVLKALRKEPEQRYSSVEQFSEDLRRHLEGLPVRARKGTWNYRASRFVRRHKYAVAVTAVFFALVLGFGIVTKMQANRIALERDKAQQVSKFMVEIFAVSDPNESKGRSVTARELLDSGSAKVERELARQPETQALLMSTIGEIYNKLALYGRGDTLLQRALLLRRRTRGDVDAEVAETLNKLGNLRRDNGDYLSADSLLREALTMQQKIFGPENLEVAKSLANLGTVHYYQGRWAAADSLLRKALAVRQRLLGPQHAEVAENLGNIASVLQAQGDYEAAEPYYHESALMLEKLLGHDNTFVAIALNNYALHYKTRGLYDKADSLYHVALEIRRKVLGPDHPNVAESLMNLAALWREKGDLQKAAPKLREALEIYLKTLGKNHPYTATAYGQLGSVMRAQKNYAAAEEYYREELAIRRATLDSNHSDIAFSLNNVATVLVDQARPAEALPLLHEAVRIMRAALPGHWQTAHIESAYGNTLLALQRYAEAEAYLLESYAVLKAKRGETNKGTVRALERIVQLYEAWGKFDKAAPYRSLLQQAKPASSSSPP